MKVALEYPLISMKLIEIGEAEAAHRGDLVEEGIRQHAQRQRRRLPAGGGEAAEQRGLGRGLIEVEREGIERLERVYRFATP